MISFSSQMMCSWERHRILAKRDLLSSNRQGGHIWRDDRLSRKISSCELSFHHPLSLCDHQLSLLLWSLRTRGLPVQTEYRILSFTGKNWRASRTSSANGHPVNLPRYFHAFNTLSKIPDCSTSPPNDGYQSSLAAVQTFDPPTFAEFRPSGGSASGSGLFLALYYSLKSQWFVLTLWIVVIFYFCLQRETRLHQINLSLDILNSRFEVVSSSCSSKNAVQS